MASLKDYANGGRTAAEAFIAELDGLCGVERAARARDKLAVHSALDRAAREMLAAGASEAKLNAWSSGFCEALNAHTRRDRQIAKMYNAIAADFAERRRYSKKPN